MVTSKPQSVATPAQVASDCLSMVVDSHDPVPLPLSIVPLQSPDPQSASDGNSIDSVEDSDGLYDVSRQDVLNAYSFVLELEEVPITTIEDLLYYRYGIR